MTLPTCRLNILEGMRTMTSKEIKDWYNAWIANFTVHTDKRCGSCICYCTSTLKVAEAEFLGKKLRIDYGR
jgi:hypothetical protein